MAGGHADSTAEADHDGRSPACPASERHSLAEDRLIGQRSRMAAAAAGTALLLAVGLGACGADGPSAPPVAGYSDGEASQEPAAAAGLAVVERVVDGDTIIVQVAGERERVRLIGIDTPETVDERRPVECFGKEASARTAALLPPGTEVRLVRDVEARDDFDRLLAYVYRADDDLFVNLTLVREGYASAYTFPPNVAHRDEIAAAASAARLEERGLWASCEGVENR